MPDIKKISNYSTVLFLENNTKGTQESSVSLFETNDDEPHTLEDCFRYERIKDANKFLYKASDGKNYNLKELILTKISCMIDEICLNKYKPLTPMQKLSDFISNNFNNIEKLENFEKILEENRHGVENSKNIKQIFVNQLGAEYTPENIEKFLSGEITLKLERDMYKSTGIKPEKIAAAPFIEENWLSDSQKSKLDKKRKNLTPKEKVKYDRINQVLNQEYKRKLRECLNAGKLLDSKSSDKSTVLDNLYKIVTQPRAKEVNSLNILNECINILSNPEIITQITEDIPSQYVKQFSGLISKQHSEYKTKSIKKILENRDVNSCVAASVEYYMAVEHPAEFFRIVEGLTSVKKEVKKYVDCRKVDLTDDVIEFYKTKNEMQNGYMEVTLKADDNAYLLANMQKSFQDDDERTSVDILTQSLIFQLAVGNTYDSITDRHKSLFNPSGEGICANEENYALKILTGNNVVCKEYKEIDEFGSIEKVYGSEQEIGNDIDNALNNGKIVLAGIYCVYEKGSELCNEGHELTIIGKTKGIDGTEYYICKDSDAEFGRAVTITKDFLLNRTLTLNIEQ